MTISTTMRSPQTHRARKPTTVREGMAADAKKLMAQNVSPVALAAPEPQVELAAGAPEAEGVAVVADALGTAGTRAKSLPGVGPKQRPMPNL